MDEDLKKKIGYMDFETYNQEQFEELVSHEIHQFAERHREDILNGEYKVSALSKIMFSQLQDIKILLKAILDKK